MIKLKKLKWSNCFSYGENNELDLSSDTLTQLVGTNGTGKSSIPLILEEVLFNKNSKGIKKADIANRKIDKGYSINLTFAVNDDEYILDVSRKGSIKCRLWKNDEDISSHTATNTYKTLEEILGIDFKTFSQIVYQNTNASLQFLTATDTNRKKFLIDLLQLDNYVKYFEVFKEMSRELGTEISSVQGKLSTIEKWLNDNKLEDTSLLPKLDLPFYSEEDEKRLRSLQVEFENITQTNKKINTNNYWKEQLELIDLDKYKMIYGEVESYDHLQEELGKWRAVAFQSKFEGTDEEVCPTCGQEVDSNLINQMQKKQETEINEAEEKIQSIRAEINTIKSNNENITERDNKKKEWEDCYRSIDQSLPSEILSAENLQQSIDDLETTISEQKQKLQEIIEENTNRERHNTRIGIIQEQTQEFENELDYFLERLNLIEDKLSCTDILKKAFSTNGLLAYKIENLVKDLEELTNEYLAELSDGRFNLQFVVLNDKLNVELDDNGKPVDILSLSAGELARVNTSTLLAIRKLMSSISKSRINVLFLDEVTNVLDETGKEKLVEILLGEEELNTYIVSHGWTHPLLSKVEVIKTDDISRLE
jgi:DNA repair exonuclease SbcCD ATPase subunit|tara:strand:+ start:315 stop:2096 length:1782 start_codon:yes stop_codon:yes gene_type:complete